MKWLRTRVERAVGEGSRIKPTREDRQALVLFATAFLGRDPASGSTFDSQVHAAVRATSTGTEALGLELLATAIRDHEVDITLEELSALTRFARVYDVHEDRWTFVGARVVR